jgi:hypothetical protein
MNPKKLKEKDRRRARKLAEEAWEAVDADNLDLAEKVIRRAVAAQPDNPVLWNDQGMILGSRRKEAEAAESFRSAISLAPTFAQPYAHLAVMRFKQGFTAEAVTWQAQAASHAPENAIYAERLATFRALLGQTAEPKTIMPTEPDANSPPTGSFIEWAGRLARLDWERVGTQLTRDGVALIPHLAQEEECAKLRAIWDDNAAFAKKVVMDRPDFGLGEYRYFRAPIPEDVDRLRRATYMHVARIANDWQALLGRHERVPMEWEAFRDDCRRAGQATPTPILLKYGPGGFNELHRDLRGTLFFPIQMAVVLSPRVDTDDFDAQGFRGGDFLFCDVPETRKARRREVAAGLGDAVLFCTRDRLVPIGGTYGLQPVKHGVARITAGIRFVLGVPFHEYR